MVRTGIVEDKSSCRPTGDFGDGWRLLSADLNAAHENDRESRPMVHRSYLRSGAAVPIAHAAETRRTRSRRGGCQSSAPLWRQSNYLIATMTKSAGLPPMFFDSCGIP